MRPLALRIKRLRELKRRALRTGCEIAALNALYHLQGAFLKPGQEAKLKAVQGEIQELEARHSVQRVRNEPMPKEVEALMRKATGEDRQK